MNKIIISLFSAAAGAAISWFITKRHYEKKLDEFAESTTDEVASMHEQLSDLHKVFVTEQPIEVAGERQKMWDKIANKAGSRVGKSDAEVVQEFREGILRAKAQSEGVDVEAWKETTNPYVSDKDIPYEVGGSIYPITSLEFYEGETKHTKEEMTLWMLEEALYDDYEEPIDAPKGSLGVTLEELMEMVPIIFDSDTEEEREAKSHLYFRNDNLKEDYEVKINREGYSPWFFRSTEG